MNSPLIRKWYASSAVISCGQDYIMVHGPDRARRVYLEEMIGIMELWSSEDF